MKTIPSTRSYSTKSPESEAIVLKIKNASSGSFSCSLLFGPRSCSIKVEWWDGTSTTYAGSNTNSYGDDTIKTILITKSIASPYNNNNEKTIKVYPVDANGNKVGIMRGILYSPPSGIRIVDCDIRGCLGLYQISLTDSSLTDGSFAPSLPRSFDRHLSLTDFTLVRIDVGTSFSFTNCDRLQSIGFSSIASLQSITVKNCWTGTANYYNTQLQVYNCSSVTSITMQDTDLGLFIYQNAALTSLDLLNSDLQYLTMINCASLTSISNFLSTMANMTSVAIYSTGLTSFTVPTASNLANIEITGNSSLTSVRAVGQNPLVYKYWSSNSFQDGVKLQNNNLSAAALDQFYTDLSTPVFTSYIRVDGNPGVGSDNPAIATAKGYTVLGS